MIEAKTEEKKKNVVEGLQSSMSDFAQLVAEFMKFITLAHPMLLLTMNLFPNIN